MTGDERSDPFSEMINLVAAPLAGTIRSFEQFRKGVDEFLAGSRTSTGRWRTSTRPRADQRPARRGRGTDQGGDPAGDPGGQGGRRDDAGRERPGDGGGSRADPARRDPQHAGIRPAAEAAGQFTEVMGEMSRRLGPLTQFAESAGGLFGGLRLPGSRARRPSCAIESRRTRGREQEERSPTGPGQEGSVPQAGAGEEVGGQEGERDDGSSPDHRVTNGVDTTCPANSLPRTSIIT